LRLYLSSRYRPLGELEHVGTFRVLSTTVALVGREFAVGVDLSLEALEECFTCWTSAGASVFGATP
jgi:hypothetical protein